MSKLKRIVRETPLSSYLDIPLQAYDRMEALEDYCKELEAKVTVLEKQVRTLGFTEEEDLTIKIRTF